MMNKVLINVIWQEDLLVADNRLIELPEGYYRVLTGAIKPTDLWLEYYHFKLTGEILWKTIDELKSKKKTAKDFSCLIRKGTPVEEPCERCKVGPKEKGCRFCTYCILIIRKKK